MAACVSEHVEDVSPSTARLIWQNAVQAKKPEKMRQVLFFHFTSERFMLIGRRCPCSSVGRASDL
jgi:hypothetical protein